MEALTGHFVDADDDWISGSGSGVSLYQQHVIYEPCFADSDCQ